MQQLQRYTIDEPYYEAIGKNDKSQTEMDNHDCINPIWIQSRQIDHRTDIYTANAIGEIQREKQRAPHGFRRH